jgi:hypothetical protein
VTTLAGQSAVGGGSLPGETLPTRLVALAAVDEERLAARLRAGTPPVIARLERERLLLDPRTVLPEDDELLLAAMRAALAGAGDAPGGADGASQAAEAGVGPAAGAASPGRDAVALSADG